MFNIKIPDRFRLLFPCYFAFFVSGAMVLLVGTTLPYIIEEAGINYSVAGGLLSAFAIGNLLASFVNPVISRLIGRKRTIVMLSSLVPLSWFIVTLLPPVAVLYPVFVLLGIGRGSVSIINNAVVNDNSDGKTAALNLLHMTFAAGALLSPLLTSLYIGAGFGWRAVAYTIAAASVLATAGYAWMKITPGGYAGEEGTSAADTETGTGTGAETGTGAGMGTENAVYYKNPVFYIMGFLLFLYLGLENCVNGWFVTYFKSMGIMSGTYATNLVSVTWIMVMLGRLATAKLSKVIDKNRLIFTYCIATAAFFLLLIATHNLYVITFAIAGLGFFFAGIYPTGVSCAGSVLKGSDTAMSMLLAIAALGGIITPQIVGILADYSGMAAAITVLLVNVAGMLILSGVGMKKGGTSG